MLDLLLTPGAPFYALSVVGALIAAAGLLKMERMRLGLVGVRVLATRKGLLGRVMLGQLAALPIVLALTLTAVAAGLAGGPRLAMLVLALAAYLYIGWVVPRRPLMQAEQERRALRRQTPGFMSYVRIALSGGESPTRLLERYVYRHEPRRAEMQAVVRESLQLMVDQRLRPFEALRIVARLRGARELSDVAEALAQSERAGGGYEQVLAAHERTLLVILEDEFKRTLRKRMLVILLISAIALVVGVLGNILWIMAGPLVVQQAAF